MLTNSTPMNDELKIILFKHNDKNYILPQVNFVKITTVGDLSPEKIPDLKILDLGTKLSLHQSPASLGLIFGWMIQGKWQLFGVGIQTPPTVLTIRENTIDWINNQSHTVSIKSQISPIMATLIHESHLVE